MSEGKIIRIITLFQFSDTTLKADTRISQELMDRLIEAYNSGLEVPVVYTKIRDGILFPVAHEPDN